MQCFWNAPVFWLGLDIMTDKVNDVVCCVGIYSGYFVIFSFCRIAQLTEEKWTFYHSSRSHIHRPSCVAMEVERLNAMVLERKIGKSILGKVRHWDVFLEMCSWHTNEQAYIFTYCIFLVKVHLAVVRYHEGGRFCEKDAPWDQISALYHLERAAMCGELEAIVALGQCCLQLPHHVLPEIELEVLHLLFLYIFIYIETRGVTVHIFVPNHFATGLHMWTICNF